MRDSTVRYNGDVAEHGAERGRVARDDGIEAGRLVDIHRSRHRILAVVGGRVLATGVLTHGAYLVQDEGDGTIQLPTTEAFSSLIRSGEAVWASAQPMCASASERMEAQVRLLDALDVPQGDKAIWIALAAHWSPEMQARFGPHDDAWKVRRWRAALRKAEAEALRSTTDVRSA